MVDHGQTDIFRNRLPESVSTFSMKIEIFSIKSGNVSVVNGTNTVTFVFSTVEVSSEANTLVAISSKSFSWLKNGVAVNAWALFPGDTFTVMRKGTVWTVASIDTLLVGAHGFWVEAAWGARASAGVVFLVGWAGNFASTVSSPFDVDTVSRTFSEV
jgi:hypothetical protein